MSGTIYGVFPVQPPILLTMKEPDAFLDYTESLAAPLTDPSSGLVDALTRLSLTIRPSGAGELLASQLTVDPTGLLATWWLAGGVAGRSYLVNLEATTAAGRVFQWPMAITIDPLLATGYPLPPPPATGFGAAVTWTNPG